MDTPRSDAAGALEDDEDDDELASKVAVVLVESSSTTVEETDPTACCHAWRLCCCRRFVDNNGDIFIATVSLLWLLSRIEDDTGPVDNAALPLEFGVKATTAAVSIVATSVASVKTAVENRIRFVRLVLVIGLAILQSLLALLLLQLLVLLVLLQLLLLLSVLPQSRARRDLFLLVSNIIDNFLCTV